MKPMLCKLIRSFDEINKEDYIMEEKKDGIRAVWNKGLFDRRGKDISQDYPQIFDELKDLHGFVLDGEICLENGTFNQLQEKKNKDKAVFYVFDVINDLPLLDRKLMLYNIYSEGDFRHIAFLLFSDFNLNIIEKLRKESKEGIILKPKNSPYIENNRGVWLKYKFTKRIIVDVLKAEVENEKLIITTKHGRIAISGKGQQQFQDHNGFKKIEVEYLEFSKNGLWRFPIFVAWVVG